MKNDQAQTFPLQRSCLREPIPEIPFAAQLLSSAMAAHALGHAAEARQLLTMANMPEIRAWLGSIWGKASVYRKFRPVPDQPSVLPVSLRTANRDPSVGVKRALLQRDGYYCRFCGIPVIRAEIRQRIQAIYPDAVGWGSTNDSQHAAFQTMWVQFDHILPHSRGGMTTLENMVVTCAACNYGRMDNTLAEVGLDDPRSRAPFQSSWSGLEAF